MHKILVIEDHLEVRENLLELLELCRYQVYAASSGEEGLILAEKEHPDLILCDITMPGIDGYEVLEQLTKNPETACIPFIFLTARTEKSDIRKGMLLGADDYLTKPFDEADLLKAVETRLRKAQILRSPVVRSKEALHGFIREAGIEWSDEPLVRKFSEGEPIFHPGDHPAHLYFVANGSVQVSRDQLTVRTCQPGDFFGFKSLILGAPYQHQAVAISNTEVSLIPTAEFFALILNNRVFSVRFIQMLADEVRERQTLYLNMIRETSEKKVLQALVQLGGETPAVPPREPILISFDALYRQTQIAPLNITLALRKLDREKYIHFRADFIQVIDLPQLQNLAS